MDTLEREYPVTKRPRTASVGATRHDSVPDCGGDCYDEILDGLYEDVNGEIRNSWLVEKRDDATDDMDDSTAVSPAAAAATAAADLGTQILSLRQQLIQIKRRLWPAAEECAQVWQSTPQIEFWNARTMANPMETLGEKRHRGLNQMFLNRSAIKLANLDAIVDFRLTRPPPSGGDDVNDQTNHNIRTPFLFADLCGAPGGFSEYIMKRCQADNHLHSSCRGYGMSLDGRNEHGNGLDWKIQNVSQQHDASRSFDLSYRICMGLDGSGDIYEWDNVMSMQHEIEEDLQKAGIERRGMDLVVADGGFDAQRDSECQEELAQKIVLCEFAASLQLLERGGTLVIKLFGCQTETIRTAMCSMNEQFDWFDMIKPISSRPASSERYAVFFGYKGLPSNWGGGPKWISNTILGRNQQDKANQERNVRLECFLNEIDRDMLVLNLKACFAILSNLERKTKDGREEEDDGGVGQQDDVQRRHHHHKINVNIYRHAWDLHRLC